MARHHGQENQNIDRDQKGRGWKSSDVIGNARSSPVRRELNADQAALRAEVLSGWRRLELGAAVRAVGPERRLAIAVHFRIIVDALPASP